MFRRFNYISPTISASRFTFSLANNNINNTGNNNVNKSLLLALSSTTKRSFLGHEIQGESERSGPQRTPYLKPDGSVVDSSIRDPDEVRRDFDLEEERVRRDNSRLASQYRGGADSNAGSSGLGGGRQQQQQQQQQNQPGGAHRQSNGAGDQQYPGSGSGRVTGLYDRAPEFSMQPEDAQNPYSAENMNHGGQSGMSDTEIRQQGLTGSIHDRENIRVRGQKPPKDLPLTDDEVDAHPAAQKMRTVGVCGMIIVLQIMWHVMTDPFDEGERFSRYRSLPDGRERPMLPYLPGSGNAAAAANTMLRNDPVASPLGVAPGAVRSLQTSKPLGLKMRQEMHEQ